MLQLTKKALRGTERAHQDIRLTAQNVAAQLCPAAMQQLQALTDILGKAPNPASPPGIPLMISIWRTIALY